MSAEAPPEVVVARLRSHARHLFWPALALIAISAAVGYFAGSFQEQWANLAVLIGGALAAVLLFLLPLLAWLGRNYTITTRRIILRHGLLTRTRQELLHSRGYDVTVRQRGLQWMFRSGDILINTGLERSIRLRDVPGVNHVQAALHDLMDGSLNPIAARRQQEQSRGSDETTAWGTR